MSARTAEVIQIQAPIKKQIQHLGGSSQGEFPELLNKLVGRLRKNGYKLIHVTKSYRKKGSVRSDNFWRKEKRVGNIKIVWLCTFTIIFEKGFRFHLDFDFWFGYSKLLENLKGNLYEKGFPYTSRAYAREFGKEEANRVLEEAKKDVEKKIKRRIGGWGKHGIIKEITNRESLDICHSREVSISSISELDRLRESLREERKKAVELIKDSLDDIEKITHEKLDELIPFSIDPKSPEGFLAFFLWFRDPGGGFEYQLYRFIQENFGKILDKERIRDALLRLEVHGYAKVKEVPNEIREELRKKGIKKGKRFYETGPEDIPGRKLFRNLKSEVDIGAYFAPLPKKRLIKHISAPNHLVDKAIGKLIRKDYLFQKKVKDFLGRTVRKVKPKKSSRGLSGREKNIVEEAWKFYNVQKDSVDRMQKSRP